MIAANCERIAPADPCCVGMLGIYPTDLPRVGLTPACALSSGSDVAQRLLGDMAEIWQKASRVCAQAGTGESVPIRPNLGPYERGAIPNRRDLVDRGAEGPAA